MLTITIPGIEEWDPIEESFIINPDVTLTLEHSLVSISKWESKWKKPFMSDTPKTDEEAKDYIQYMILDETYDETALFRLTQSNIESIRQYIDDPQSATWFKDTKGHRNREIITSELIYYWMIASQIPFECQYWHLNRLLTLIRVCNEKNNPKKMRKDSILRNNASLNAARRAAMGSKG